MRHDQLDVIVAAVAGVVLVSVLAVRAGSRVGMPSLLIYLGVGVVIGEAGLGLQFEEFDLTRSLGFVALAIILAEGGLTSRWGELRPVAGIALCLATLGVVVSVAVVALAAHLLLGVDTRTAVLLGAVVSSTDAAAVFSVLRRLPLPRRLSATLEAESGLNDPTAVILVTLAASDAWGSTGAWGLAGLVVYELLAGGAVGLAVGWAGRLLLARVTLPAAGLYPIAVMCVALLGFAAAGLVGASSFASVYVAGLVLGSGLLPHRGSTLAFAEAMALLAQIGMFIMLGLLASPNRLPEAVVPALVIGLVLTLLARPLSVALPALGFRVPLREQAFLSAAGLRGAVPIVLATIPATEHYPHPERVFDVVFLLVAVFTAVQAPTLPWIARRLGVSHAEGGRALPLEATALDQIDGELLQIGVEPPSRLRGTYVHHLRLPPGAEVVAVIRDGATLTPDRIILLRYWDQLLVVTDAEARAEAVRVLEEVSRRGTGEPQPAGPTTAGEPGGYPARWGRREHGGR